MNRHTVQVPHNFYSREVSVSRRRPPTTPVSRQNRRVPLCNDGISLPQDTSFPGTSPGMSLDSLPNVGMRIDNDIDDYGSDSELSSNNSGQFNSTLNDFVQSVHFRPRRCNYRIPTRGTSTAVNSDMTTMLQQQQAVLTKNLQKKSFLKKTEQKEFESKLIAVENHINDQITPTSSSGDSFNTWKRVVNRALSNKVPKIHSTAEKQFNPPESSCSKYNSDVKENIIKEICSQPENKFTEDIIVKVAVKQCYKSCCRTYLEDQDGKEDFVKNQAKRRKYRSHRDRQ